MNFLLERWRRGPIHRYFAGLDPMDRATALIVLALAIAFAFSYAAIARYQARSVDVERPALTAPPFLLDFAEAEL